MRTRVRFHTDRRVSQFVTDTEIDEQINVSIAHVWGELASAGGERYCESNIPQAITTVAGTATYALPADHMKTSRLVVVLDGREYPLEPFVDQETYGTRPVNKAWSLRHYYVPASPILTGVQTFDGINGHEEMACLHAAMNVKQMSEEDMQGLVMLYGIEKDRLIKQRSPRSKQAPFRMPDVLSNRQRPWWDHVIPNTDQLPRYQLMKDHIELREGFGW